MEMVGSDEDFEERARPLAEQVGIPVYEYSTGHKPGGGTISTAQFTVGLSPVGLKAAFGNKPDPVRVAAFVDAVVKEAAQNEQVPESEIREDIEDAANRSGVRARREIKLLDAAVSEIRRATKGRHRDDRQQGEIRALELLRDHMMPTPEPEEKKTRPEPGSFFREIKQRYGAANYPSRLSTKELFKQKDISQAAASSLMGYLPDKEMADGPHGSLMTKKLVRQGFLTKTRDKPDAYNAYGSVSMFSITDKGRRLAVDLRRNQIEAAFAMAADLNLDSLDREESFRAVDDVVMGGWSRSAGRGLSIGAVPAPKAKKEASAIASALKKLRPNNVRPRAEKAALDFLATAEHEEKKMARPESQYDALFQESKEGPQNRTGQDLIDWHHALHVKMASLESEAGASYAVTGKVPPDTARKLRKLTRLKNKHAAERDRLIMAQKAEAERKPEPTGEARKKKIKSETGKLQRRGWYLFSSGPDYSVWGKGKYGKPRLEARKEGDTWTITTPAGVSQADTYLDALAALVAYAKQPEPSLDLPEDLEPEEQVDVIWAEILSQLEVSDPDLVDTIRANPDPFIAQIEAAVYGRKDNPDRKPEVIKRGKSYYLAIDGKPITERGLPYTDAILLAKAWDTTQALTPEEFRQMEKLADRLSATKKPSRPKAGDLFAEPEPQQGGLRFDNGERVQSLHFRRANVSAQLARDVAAGQFRVAPSVITTKTSHEIRLSPKTAFEPKSLRRVHLSEDVGAIVGEPLDKPTRLENQHIAIRLANIVSALNGVAKALL